MFNYFMILKYEKPNIFFSNFIVTVHSSTLWSCEPAMVQLFVELIELLQITTLFRRSGGHPLLLMPDEGSDKRIFFLKKEKRKKKKRKKKKGIIWL
mgnify:CR=1 FL=1